MNAKSIAAVVGLLALAALAWGCPDKPRAPSPHAPGSGAAAHETSPAKTEAAPSPEAHNPALKITDVSFAGPAGHRPDASFSRGEAVLCLFTVSNFTYAEREAHIRADVKVLGPGGQTMVLQPDMKLLQGKAPTLRPGIIRTAANLLISPAAPAGKHTVELTIRDVLGKRRGVGQGTFTIVGKPPSRAPKLTINAARLAGDARIPAGSVVPVYLEVAGFAARAERGLHLVDLAVEARVLSAAGKAVHAVPEETLVRGHLQFSPLAHPAEFMLPLPRALPGGKYQAVLKITDRLHTTAAASVTLPLEVVASSFAIFNLHAHDASQLPRQTFLLGEQIFIRLSVQGLAVKDGKVSAAVDLGVLGPHNDQHMARKDAATTANPRTAMTAAQVGRYPVQLPLTLPSLAPTGTYRLVVRARDLISKKQIQRELKIKLEGSAPRPFARFKVDDLEVRDRADLPPSKGDTFGAGRTYQLTLKVGGVKPEKTGARNYRVRVKGGLTLRDLAGKVVHQQKTLFSLQREMTYRPLRLLIPGKWTVPADLPGGLYDLGVSLESLHDRMVTQMNRRVEIVRPR